MGCHLRIAGKKLDIDDFILKSKLIGFDKKYKNVDRRPKSNGKNYSFVIKTISKASMRNYQKQVSDAISYLKKNKKKLSNIVITKEIEYATLEFFIRVESVSKDYFAQYLYFPKELTNLCGELNIGIELTLV